MEFIGSHIGEVSAGIAKDLGLPLDRMAREAGARQAARVKETGQGLREKARARAERPRVEGFPGDVLGGVGSIGAGPLSALSEAQSVYEEMTARGVVPEVARHAATVSAVVNTTLDTLALGKVLSPFVKPIKAAKPGLGRLANAVRGALEGMQAEGITETLQSLVSQAATEFYDATTDFFDEQGFMGVVEAGKKALYEGVVGMVVGGGVGSVGGLVGPKVSEGTPSAEATDAPGATITPEMEVAPEGTPGSPTGLGEIDNTGGGELVPMGPQSVETIIPTPPPPGEAEVEVESPGQGKQALPPYEPEVSFEVDDETMTEGLRRKWQDRFLRLEKVQGAAKKQGRAVGFARNALTKAHLYYARAADRLDRVNRLVVDPLLKEMADAEVTPDELSDFLYAEHAPSRNQRLREKNQSVATVNLANIDAEIRRVQSEQAAATAMAPEVDTPLLGEGRYQRQKSQRHRRETRDAIRRAASQLEKLEAKRARYQKIFDDQNVDGLSGMTDQEARLIITKAHMAGNLPALRKLAQKFRRNIIQERLRISVAEGLLTQKTADALNATFKDGTYVPLMVPSGTVGHEGPLGVSKGRGFNVRGPEAQKLKGGLAVRRESPFIRGIIELEKTIQRAEKNKVARAFYEFVKLNPNEKLYRVTEEPITTDARQADSIEQPGDENLPDTVTVGGVELDPREVFVDGGLEFHDADPRIQYGDNVMALKVDGRRAIIEFRDQALANAMLNLEAKHAMPLVRAYANFFRSINTVLSPGFVVFNLWSDFQTALLNATGETDPAAARSIAKNAKSALVGLYKASRERSKFEPEKLRTGREIETTAQGTGLAAAKEIEPGGSTDIPIGGDWKAWGEDFNRRGGRTGFFVMDLDLETKIGRLNKAIAKHNSRKVAARHFETTLERVNDLITSINESVEGASRVAFYRHLVEDRGWNPDEAVLAAKNLTVNFDKKGEYGGVLNSWYVFSNASIQGTTQMLRSLKRSPTVRKMAAGGVAAAAGLAAWNTMMAGDEYEKLVKARPDLFERDLIIYLPNGGVLKMRMPYGYNIFTSLGQTAHAVAAGHIDVSEGMKRFLMAAAQAFNPLSASSIGTFLFPTIGDPLMEIIENRNFAGIPIRPENSPYGRQKPASRLHFKSVSPAARVVAEKIAEWTGGTPYESGAIELNPEILDHIASGLTGSVGREIAGLLNATKDIATGNVPESRDIPIWRRLYTAPSEQVNVSFVYDVKRMSGMELLDTGDLALYMTTLEGLARRKAIGRDFALDGLNEVTRNQGKILATRAFPKAEGKAWEARVERETAKLRMSPAYRRAHLVASGMPKE